MKNQMRKKITPCMDCSCHNLSIIKSSTHLLTVPNNCTMILAVKRNKC